MGTRFDSAARKAIDFAMIEVERRGSRALDPSHLLLGLLHASSGTIPDALHHAGVEIDVLRATVAASLGRESPPHQGDIDVARATEQILQRSSELSAARAGSMVSDLDILIAVAEHSETDAGQLLDDFNLTPVSLRARTIDPPRPKGEPAPAAAAAVRPADRPATVRTGVGYDSHRFGPGGPLILGGVRIPADTHLVGHSDGDAVAHALTDAVLGACGGGDIGEMFADTDPANEGRDSIGMLRQAVARARGLGWSVEHVDVVVVAEAPRVGPHRGAMREALAPALGVSPDAVSIKGKSNEGMGWIGRGEGIACIAVATLTRGPGE